MHRYNTATAAQKNVGVHPRHCCMTHNVGASHRMVPTQHTIGYHPHTLSCFDNAG